MNQPVEQPDTRRFVVIALVEDDGARQWRKVSEPLERSPAISVILEQWALNRMARIVTRK